MLWLISQRSLLPGIVILGGFILFVLWLVGLIVTSIEFWGPTGNVNTECNIWVVGQNTNGVSIATLAWLEQHSICKFLVFFLACSRLFYNTLPTTPLFLRGALMLWCFIHLLRVGLLTLKFLGQSWQAAFAFALVGTIFLLWVMIMSYNVYQGD
jgi:hypothetical protein